MAARGGGGKGSAAATKGADMRKGEAVLDSILRPKMATEGGWCEHTLDLDV